MVTSSATVAALSRRGDAPGARRGAVPNAVLGMLIFLATEAMFFAGLISGFLVLRAATAGWPPPGQPRLPAAVTALNTLVLLGSGYTMWRALAAARGRRSPTGWLLVTAALGAVFVAVQGSEWAQLLQFGWRSGAETRAGTFYTVIAAHGVHVLGGLVVLLGVLWNARRGRYAAGDCAAVEACQLYWSFVVAVWPVLYGLVYLS